MGFRVHKSKSLQPWLCLGLGDAANAGVAYKGCVVLVG
jgi:hypothetical protein